MIKKKSIEGMEDTFEAIFQRMKQNLTIKGLEQEREDKEIT